MRIAELVNNLEIGGAERIVADLAVALQARNHSVHVVCMRGEGPLAAPLREAGVTVASLNKPSGFSLASLRRLVRYLREHRIEVIHTHNPLVHHYGALAGRANGAGVVNTLHGPGNLAHSPKTRWIYDAACLLSDSVVSVCHTVQANLKECTRIGRRRSLVIPNGIPVAPFVAVRCGGSDVFTFGTVGRLAPVKDHLTMIQAFAQFHQQYPQSRLEILGDGPMYPDLTCLVENLGLQEHVRFYGSSLNVPAFLSRLNVFILSSLYEGLPLSVLEAMAAGLPLVATSVGEITTLVKTAGCGWLCPPGDAQALTGGMLAARRCRTLAELGMQARAYVTQRHSSLAMVNAYEHLFVSLIAGRHKPNRLEPTKQSICSSSSS
jgi:glycosyltransferase involved in cell wall biosynthesis